MLTYTYTHIRRDAREGVPFLAYQVYIYSSVSPTDSCLPLIMVNIFLLELIYYLLLTSTCGYSEFSLTEPFFWPD